MNLETLIGAYLAALKVGNYSVRTIDDRGYSLKLLDRFLRERGREDVRSVTPSLMAEFQKWLFYEPTSRGGARSVAHQNRVLTPVKSFFQFLKREGYLPVDPAAQLEYAREPKSLPRNVLTPQEARKVLESVDTGSIRGYRDRTILEVLYATGIRQTELLGLEVGDVNLEEGLLRVRHGKGGRERVTPLGREACRCLETYLNGVRPDLLALRSRAKKGDEREKLFLSAYGRPMDRNTLGKLVRDHGKLSGIKKRVSCHVWRHTCATHLLKNRANLRHVQEILGHRSLATTERYLHLTIMDLKEAHTRCHPRERWKTEA